MIREAKKERKQKEIKKLNDKEKEPYLELDSVLSYTSPMPIAYRVKLVREQHKPSPKPSCNSIASLSETTKRGSMAKLEHPGHAQSCGIDHPQHSKLPWISSQHSQTVFEATDKRFSVQSRSLGAFHCFRRVCPALDCRE